MKRIEIYKGIYSSPLGFGCAPILGSVDARTANRAIEVALECGINHFDLARSYGYGDAEEFVGKILKNKRDRIVLVSKFGIKANWKASLFKPFKPLIRKLKGNDKKRVEIPAIKKETSSKLQIADHFHDRISITGNNMRSSLEKTLNALSTDHLDIFMIHEPNHKLLNIDELVYTADKLKEEGKIKALGLAFMKDMEDLHADYLEVFDVLQFNNSPGGYGYDQTLRSRQDKSNIFFSPLRGGANALTPLEKLKKLTLDFPKSVTLCSMFNEKHIRMNSDVYN